MDSTCPGSAERSMAEMPRTTEPEAETQRLFELFQPPFLQEARRWTRLCARKATPQRLGKTEFERRDAVHHRGAQPLETARDERKKDRGKRAGVKTNPPPAHFRDDYPGNDGSGNPFFGSLPLQCVPREGAVAGADHVVMLLLWSSQRHDNN